MKLICPKCQYENQADSARIVCARCATLIEVKQDQNAGLDSNGRRQTARLPFVGNVSNSQPLSGPPSNPNPDVYATRIGDDFDDVLDIPRQSEQTSPSGNEQATAFEDVFAMPSYDAQTSYDFPPQERKPTAPIEGFPTGQGRQRETQDYASAPEPEFMGWPVLPENADYEQEQAGNFSANRKTMLARVALVIVVFGMLSFLAYYFFGDKLARRQSEGDNIAANASAAGNQAGSTTTYPPATVPSIETKSAAVEMSKPSDNSSTAKNLPQPSTATKDNAKPVSIEPVPEGKVGQITKSPAVTTQQSAAVAPLPKSGNLTIQIASFSDQAQANDRVSRLRAQNIDARVVKAEIQGKGTWYRVQVGGFKSREEALGYANQLKSRGILQDFIVTTIGK
ncbi:MAG: SPOR domain-containing protein [Blastocatellales bacterium]